MKKFLVVTIALWICSAIHAQTQASQTDLSPETQRTFDRGLLAVEQKEWELAVKYFSEAQKASPTAPALLFNLGLAHAKAGRELPAIAWLNAYLAAAPQASNAEAVRKEINRLELSTEIKRDKIFQSALIAAERLPTEQRASALFIVAGSQAEGGDINGALQTPGVEIVFLGRNQLSRNDPEQLWVKYGKALGSEGDLDAAQDAFNHASDMSKVCFGGKDCWDDVWESVAIGLANPHTNNKPNCVLGPPDFEAAHVIADKIKDPTERAKTIQKVSEVAQDRARMYSETPPVINVPTKLLAWLRVAVAFSEDPYFSRYGHLDRLLQDAVTKDYISGPARPENIPQQIAYVGQNLGQYLMRLRALEKKFAREAKPAN